MKKQETSFSLKDQLFNQQTVDGLAVGLEDAWVGFDRAGFVRKVVQKFPELELKQCIDWMACQLQEHLPQSYPEALEIVLASLPEELDGSLSDDDFGHFVFAAHSRFVSLYGCTEEHLEKSLVALRAITKRFSAEYAIRFFLNDFPRETLDFLGQCATDEHYHVRRLASEGTRPKLPWAQKLEIAYTEPLPLLHQLHADPTRFVTRSVANHLNDISKLEPGLVVETLKQWQEEGRQEAKELDYMTRHALRTLVKQADPAALKLLGYGAKPKCSGLQFRLEQSALKVGESLKLHLSATAEAAQGWLIDYAIEYTGDSSVRGGRKVFKWKQVKLKKGQSLELVKAHPMKLMSTRRLHLGQHKLTLFINGKEWAQAEFELKEA